MRKYSHSAFKTFQRCAKKWSYIYIDKIVPKESPVYLTRGINLHEHLAVLYDHDYMGAGRELTDEDTALLMRYHDKWHAEDVGWKVISVEEDYEFEVAGFPVVFKPDLVVEINGEVWIVDHKTTVNIPDEWDPYNMSDFQHLLYVAGLRSLGYDVKGFIFNYIRTKAPTQPALVKAGDRIAYLAKMDTDYNTLLNFALEHKMETDTDVREKLTILRHAPDKFFQRHFLIVPETAINEMLIDVENILIEMAESEITGGYPRHVVAKHGGSQACGRCPYQPLCHAELLGIDTEPILLEYKEREKRK